MPGIAEKLETLRVESKALALCIWRVNSAHIRPFIPVDAKPFKVALNGRGIFRAGPIRIYVFHPQDDLPRIASGSKPRKHERPCIT